MDLGTNAHISCDFLCHFCRLAAVDPGYLLMLAQSSIFQVHSGQKGSDNVYLVYYTLQIQAQIPETIEGFFIELCYV